MPAFCTSIPRDTIRHCRVPLAFIVCWALLSAWVRPATADEPAAKYFEQLRARRLFGLAEGECLRRLSRAELPAEQRTMYTLEFSRTLAEHARYTSGDEQADLWKQATSVIDNELAKAPQSLGYQLLEVQRAFIPAVQGEYFRWQAELLPHDAAMKQAASTALDLAISRLTEAEKSLDESLSSEARRFRRPGSEARVSLSAFELRALLHNVRYRLGIALHDRAQLLPNGDADRVEALLEAEQWFRPLAAGLPGEEMTWNSQVFLAQNQRLRGDLKQAAHILDAIVKNGPPPDVHDRMIAEQVWILLDEKKATDASQLLVEHRRGGGPPSGELLFLSVKALLALWETAANRHDSALADQLMQQVDAHVGRAEREIGGYWAFRCRLILEMAHDAREYGIELAPMIRRARAQFAAGELDQAVDEYGTAAAAAFRNGQNDLAMDLGYTRASILLQSGKYEAAGRDFRELAERFPAHQRAAPAHLLHAYCLGKLYDEQSTRARREAYTAALLAHREKFSGDSTAAEATWMLAQLEERRLQYTKALALYLEIPGEHGRGPLSQAAVARCYEWILGRLRELKQPPAEWEAAAIEQLNRFVAGFPTAVSTSSVLQGEVAMRLARIQLNRAQPDYVAADRLLEFVLAGAAANVAAAIAKGDAKADAATSRTEAEIRASWQQLRTTAIQLRIVSLSGQDRVADARLLVQDLSEHDVSAILSVLDGLMQLADDADEQMKTELASLQLKAAESLASRRKELTDDQQLRLDRCLGQAYASTHQPRKAIEAYERLSVAHPRDLDVLRTLSQLLVECNTAECLAKARDNWRKIESLEKAGSSGWLEARYNVARCLFLLKQYAECGKLLAVTRLLYPNLGSEELKSKYAQLELENKKSSGD